MFVKYIGIPDLTVTVDEGPILCVTDEVIEISNADYNVLRQRYPGDFVTEEHGSNPVDSDVNVTTYTDLFTNITNSTLIPGATYELPFETIWLPRNLVVDDVNVETGATETIRVIAATNNTLLEQAQSVTFPEDSIWYDITPKVVGTSINTKGTIYKRVNNPRNLQFIPTDGDKTKSNDFRAVKSPFWMMDKNDISPSFAPGTTGYFSAYPITTARTFDPGGGFFGAGLWTPVVQTITIVDTNDYILRNILNDDLTNKKDFKCYGNLEDRSVLFEGSIINSVLGEGSIDLYVNSIFDNFHTDSSASINGFYDQMRETTFTGTAALDLWMAGTILNCRGHNISAVNSYFEQISGCEFIDAIIDDCNFPQSVSGGFFGGWVAGIQSLAGMAGCRLDVSLCGNMSLAGFIKNRDIESMASFGFNRIVITGGAKDFIARITETSAVKNLDISGSFNNNEVHSGGSIDGLITTGNFDKVDIHDVMTTSSFASLDNVEFHGTVSTTTPGSISNTVFDKDVVNHIVNIADTQDGNRFFKDSVTNTRGAGILFSNNLIFDDLTSFVPTLTHSGLKIHDDLSAGYVSHTISATVAAYTALA